MKQIKRRLYGLYFLIVATFVFLMYFVLTNIAENRIIDQQRDRMDDEITTLATYIENHPMNNTIESIEQDDILEILLEVSPVINERITFLNVEGEALYDSVFEVEKLGNLFNYSEIQQVLNGEVVGVANRKQKDATQSLYFVAQAIYNDENEAIGILRLSSEITDLADTIQFSLVVQLVSTIVLALLLVLLTSKWINRITNSMNEMEKVVNDLTHFDYEARYSGHSYEEIDELGYSMNELAENLEQQEIEIKTSDERIYGLINHLIIGVMLLDEERRIQVVNPVMNELLGINLYGKITHLYTDYIKSAELIELIEAAYERKCLMNSEVRLYFPEEKRLDVNVVPIPGREQGELNYIVLLYDLTEIRRLENIRTDFAANVSHELRTPITALKGFSETLLDGAMDDKEVLTEFLEIMLIESTRLDSMVQDILKLSQLEQRQTSLSEECVNVGEVVEDIFQILQQKIELKEMTCYIEQEEPVLIYTNHDQFKQMLMNLLANAIAYTPERGKVVVVIRKENEKVNIQVIDNGIGIPEKDQGRIFERFYRVDKARSRNSGGTGLGLSIVKWLIESMDGQIELYSKVDEGTTFNIILPIQNKDFDKS